MGLAHEVAEDAAARAADIARAVAGFSPAALQNGMDFVQRVRGLDWQQAGVIAREARNRQFAGDDFQEGIRAFHQKRKPRWPSLGDADA
jgi:enoyl-CoA hydratase/carnithine racemase